MTETMTKGELTQVEIVNAAHLLFLENGYHGTSMRQIAERAGIALGGIYNHFAGKEDIFEAVVMAKHPYHEIIPAMKQAEGETAEDVIRNMMLSTWEAVKDREDILNLIYIEMVEFNGKHVSRLFKILFPEFMDFLKKIYQTKKGLVDVPLQNFMRAMVSMILGFMLTEQLINKNLPKNMQKNALEDTIKIFLHGALSKETKQ